MPFSPLFTSLRFAFQSQTKLYLISDFFNGGELFFYLSNGRFYENRARFYAAEIAMGLHYLHSKGIVYRYDPDAEIVLGKGVELADGKDVAIVATGVLMVDAALSARDILLKKGIDATVIDLHTIRPLDTELIEKAARRCGCMLVMENGRYPGGTGEMIAAHLARTVPVRMDFMNVGERFGEVGNLQYLAQSFGFTAEAAAEKAESIAR